MELGPAELLIILVIVLLLFGVGRVSKIGGELGSAVANFRKGLDEGGKKASGARGVGEDAARAPARRARGVGDAHPEDPPRARRHRRGKP